MTASIVKEAEGGLAHIAEVLRRWWVLLVVGTAFALGLAGLVLVATPVHYSTQVDALVDQPSLTSSPQAGQPTVQKLAALMPTYAEVAVSRSEERRVGKGRRCRRRYEHMQKT